MRGTLGGNEGFAENKIQEVERKLNHEHQYNQAFIIQTPLKDFVAILFCYLGPNSLFENIGRRMVESVGPKTKNLLIREGDCK